VLLPLSPPVSGAEVGKIIGVFCRSRFSQQCLKLLNILPVIGFVVMLATTAYFARGLQILLGSSKRSVIERAEEMGVEDDDIPLTQMSRNLPNLEEESSTTLATDLSTNTSIRGLAYPSRAQDPSQVRGTGKAFFGVIFPI